MQINLNKTHNIYFIGIGGISMSALALLCLKWGKNVSGSDKQKSEITTSLKQQGIKVYYSHSINNITLNTDLVVYTSAIGGNNIELKQAKKLNIKTIERASFLNLIAKQFKYVIAISGTHGKTTTCGMVANIFKTANLNPTVQVGGIMKNYNSNYINGDKNYFITEACEYKKHMLKLNPTVSAVLNMEPDHMECYSNFNNLKNCFIKFLNKSSIGICNTNIPNCINYIEKYKVKNIRKLKHNNYSFDVYFENEKNHICLKVPGKHNIQNALCAIAISKVFDISNIHIIKGLNSFLGIKRRFEVIGKINNATIISDYAHHPTEIFSTLNILKESKTPFVLFFQPHTYSRTEKLFDNFISVLKDVKNLYIFKTYPAREKASMGKSALQLSNALKNSYYIKSEKQLIETIKELSKNEINIALVGAGNMIDIVKNIIS